MTVWINQHANIEMCGIKVVDSLKILGVIFRKSLAESEKSENWMSKIDNIKRTLRQWEHRNLSTICKINIIKTLRQSQLIRSMQSISLRKAILTLVNILLFKFISQKRYSNIRAFEKFKREIVCS